MTRRRFILGLFALAAAIIGTTILVIPFKNVVNKIIRKQLAYLNLEPTSVDRFANDMSVTQYYDRKNFGWKKQLFVRVFQFFDNPWIALPGKSRYEQYCTFFVNDFLLSTDFFLNKMDESKQVNYLALYEPYKRPCVNPFSNLFYPDI